MIQFGRFSLVLLITVILCGCANQSKKQRELDAYFKEVESRPSIEIDPIPEIPKYQAFKYSAGNLQDPFKPPKPKAVVQGLQPDRDRPKEELEAFPLDALRMVGTLNKGNKTWALIAAPDDAIYRITVGGHLGQNFGQIKKISKDLIEVTETVPDGLGGWKKRNVTLTLSD